MSEKYVQVYTANGMLEAETIRAFLESMGIEAFVSQESVGMTYGLTVGPLGEARIYVPDDQVDQAIAALTEMEKGELNENAAGQDQDDRLDDPFE
ncbi:MAG: DUF2007 domain-containing protein [Chloroflexi bacterium]|nr:DUF2007 domain-containing protein [Chloroflexota bacterium]